MRDAVHKCVAEPQSVEAVATRIIDAPASAGPVAKFIKHEVEKRSLGNSKTEERYSKLAEVVADRKIVLDDGIYTKRMDSTRYPSLPTDIFDNKQNDPNLYCKAMSSDESRTRHYHTRYKKRSSRLHRTRRHHRYLAPPMH